MNTRKAKYRDHSFSGRFDYDVQRNTIIYEAIPYVQANSAPGKSSIHYSTTPKESLMLELNLFDVSSRTSLISFEKFDESDSIELTFHL